MGVSLYYTAYRDTALSAGEREQADQIAERGTRALLDDIGRRLPDWHARGVVPEILDDPREVCEGLAHDPAAMLEAGAVLSGSSKLSHTRCGWQPMQVQAEHYMAVLGEVRRAVAGAAWRVHIDDTDLVWQDGRYHLPSTAR